MPASSAPSLSPPLRSRLLLAGRVLVVAIVVGATGVVGYDLWLWLFADGLFERVAGVPVEARIEVSIRPASPGVSAAPRPNPFTTLHP